MAVRAETGVGDRTESGPGTAPGETAPRQTFPGALEQMLGTGPVFRSRLRGYDPMEVDTYVAWAETELRTVRRQVDDLLSRFGACSAELEISRRLLADAPRSRVVFPVSDRVEEMLRLAAEEAAAITDAGAREAEHLVAEARSEADARLRKAHAIKEMAVVAADELRDHARRQQAEATAMLDRARAEAAELLQAAAEERDRLAAEAAAELELAAEAAATRLAELQEEVADLRRQRDQARQSLRGLSSRIGEALQAVAATVPDDMSGTNVAVEGMTDVDVPEQPAAEGAVLLVRRPASVAS